MQKLKWTIVGLLTAILTTACTPWSMQIRVAPEKEVSETAAAQPDQIVVADPVPSTVAEPEIAAPTPFATPVPTATPTAKPATGTIRTNPLYRNYKNGRFGFTIDVPDFLYDGREPDNGSGLSFTSQDKTVVLSAYGYHDALMLNSIDALYQEELQNAEFSVSYKVKKNNWCVLSGEKGSTVYYEKFVYKSDNTINSFVITYPKSIEKTMDPVVTRLNSSFKTGVGADSATAQ